MLELEAKLLVPDEAAFAALCGMDRIGRLPLRPLGAQLQQDTYVDTAGLRLLAAGYACRLRHVGHRAFAALKGRGRSAGWMHEREEVELEIDNPSIGALLRLQEAPGPFVRRLTGGQKLVRLLTLVTRRRTWDVMDSRRVVLRVALDRSVFFVSSGERELLELEVESLDGDRGLLAEAAYELRRRYGLSASGLSKFERGLRWAGVTADCGWRIAE